MNFPGDVPGRVEESVVIVVESVVETVDVVVVGHLCLRISSGLVAALVLLEVFSPKSVFNSFSSFPDDVNASV